MTVRCDKHYMAKLLGYPLSVNAAFRRWSARVLIKGEKKLRKCFIRNNQRWPISKIIDNLKIQALNTTVATNASHLYNLHQSITFPCNTFSRLYTGSLIDNGASSLLARNFQTKPKKWNHPFLSTFWFLLHTVAEVGWQITLMQSLSFLQSSPLYSSTLLSLAKPLPSPSKNIIQVSSSLYPYKVSAISFPETKYVIYCVGCWTRTVSACVWITSIYL